MSESLPNNGFSVGALLEKIIFEIGDLEIKISTENDPEQKALLQQKQQALMQQAKQMQTETAVNIN